MGHNENFVQSLERIQTKKIFLALFTTRKSIGPASLGAIGHFQKKFTTANVCNSPRQAQKRVDVLLLGFVNGPV